MSDNPASRRQTLLEKISGPNAVSITKLVQQGEVASLRVRESFDSFLKLRVAKLEEMQSELAPGNNSAWDRFYTVAHDIRGSSTLAGNWPVNAVCLSLERLLQERDPADARMPTAIASHISALHLIIAGGIVDKDSQNMLTAQLARAVDCLPHKPPV